MRIHVIIHITFHILNNPLNSVLFLPFHNPDLNQVFYIGKEDGNIDVWDLMDRSHEPSMSQNISSSAVTSLVPYRVSSKQVTLFVVNSHEYSD